MLIKRLLFGISPLYTPLLQVFARHWMKSKARAVDVRQKKQSLLLSCLRRPPREPSLTVDHNFSERYVYDILGLRRPRRMAITTDNEDGDIDADSDTDEDDDVNDHDSAEESDDGVLYELVDGALL